jgi:hypothetical protein
MKREKLLSKIAELGGVFIRHGKKHDIYENPRTHELTQIPRHSDINEYASNGIISVCP